MPTWHSFHLGVWLLGFCPLGSPATRDCAHQGLCSLLVLSNLDSAHVLVRLFGSQSNWVLVYLNSVYLGSLQHDILPTWDCVHYLFFQLRILPTCGSVYFGVSPPGWMSTWNLSTWESVLMTFFPSRIVSSIGSINSGLCSLLVLSTWESVHLGVCLLGICTLGSLATWNSAHVGLCPLLFLAILDSDHVLFSLLRIVFIKDFFYLRSGPLGILFACMFVYLDPVFFGVWPHDILPTKDCFHYWLYQLWILLTFGFVYLGLC